MPIPRAMQASVAPPRAAPWHRPRGPRSARLRQAALPHRRSPRAGLLRAWIVLLGCLLSACLLPAPAFAQSAPRAWLDRDHVALGETATLNIEVDGIGAEAPDYSPLMGDFRVSGNSSSRSFQGGSGGMHARTLFAVALQPRRAGRIAIPPLRVDGQRTPPLSLEVGTATATPAQAGSAVFIEAELDAARPYVQQAVGYTLRLYSATPLVSGQLDQAEPEGASLQRVGDDLQYNREMAGRRYNVVERHFLLIPERSGQVAIPPARFRGRGVAGFFDDLFGDGQRELDATGPQRQLEVRPIPAQAPQPWLPLHGLELRYVQAPRTAQAGEAVQVVVEADADGATAAQLPDLVLPPVDGAQVFADPPQSDDRFDAGRPHVRLRRGFALVPSAAGTLRVPGPRVDWWDVEAGRLRTATLPDLVLTVAPGAAAPGRDGAAGPAPGTASDGDAGPGRWIHVPGVQGEVRPWALAAVVFALLWLGTLMWALQRRRPAAPAQGRAPAPGSAAPGGAAAAADPRAGLAQLKRHLDHGDLADVLATLCAMARPPVRDADALRERLAEASQRDAVALAQRARWGDGDGSVAREALRRAFAKGPAWREPAGRPRQALPPLYPEA